MRGHFGLCSVRFSFVISSKLIIFVCCKNIFYLQTRVRNEKGLKRSLKELPFYKAPVENHALSGLITLTCCVSAHIIPQLPIKYCKNIKSYSIEVKDSSIKDLFKDFLNETKALSIKQH